MATTFSLTGSLRLTPRIVDTLSLTDVTDTAAINYGITMADGAAADQANRYWKDVVTVAASTTETVDLEALDLNVFGGTGTLDMASQKVVVVRNLSATAISVALGTSLTATLAAGGVVYGTNPSAAGWAETSLTLTNAGGAAVDVEIHLVGVKAT
jgi:hypothetical protein